MFSEDILELDDWEEVLEMSLLEDLVHERLGGAEDVDRNRNTSDFSPFETRWAV
ncbi:hypothetical protein FRC03_005520 [Tulasnella sp. 419]|nr:hypothetical protein FRC03_005520 [Tulasnella sp. 419]